ncbi:putative F-box domain-containing protein [Helianthus annuus]|uniref:F-box domain-containing protein n=1 Tax=Helianthus annuus TaxID=4232 RepID=A0A9K3JP08_HELAN|nr:putative F-box protein At1g32420 [Helianthus annuus]KAF5818685.1 putative F-box domain-containing protein [Helianthus annuus]KAJ0604932.1 putative F-box domain-containing protein [Helianthus annuus]KAJ0618948.1 putative F-box domain-containing protein [Helianthus annuus]KAJ0777403.1 putative F-box domain-containing protein [Helianthus annuus]KAJ0952005.1 putative F-box domain-containing protein [Helianthus annuus]
METLEDEQSTKTDDTEKPKISVPGEVIEEILLRLPVKSVLRFRTLSKPWLSHISNPSFTKLHFTRATAAHRTALFISAYDEPTRKRHFLSTAHDGGPVTHLMTLDEPYSTVTTQAEHLNGTRKIFKLPHPYTDDGDGDGDGEGDLCYLFGFDESRNEHKILMIKKLLKEPTRVQIMTLSVNLFMDSDRCGAPVGFSWASFYYESSVCVNSVVHIMLLSSYDILAFDLRTDKFSIISTPQGVRSHGPSWSGRILLKLNGVRITKINGYIGVVCHYCVGENNEMHIWILQDYENRVWVKEIITFLDSWIELDGSSPFPFPLDVNIDEVIFCPQNRTRLSFPQVLDQTGMVYGDEMSVPIYNRRSRCWKS